MKHWLEPLENAVQVDEDNKREVIVIVSFIS
jgi:hypothetical protein